MTKLQLAILSLQTGLSSTPKINKILMKHKNTILYIIFYIKDYFVYEKNTFLMEESLKILIDT